MAIDDLIANPEVAPVGQMFSRGMADLQTRRLNNLEFLVKQFGYNELLKNVSLEDKKRRLETGKVDFQLSKQPEKLERDYTKETVDSEYGLMEQLRRGINNPERYNQWAQQKVLPAQFLGPDGNALPFEATAKQRAAFEREALDSTPHMQDKELALIKTSTGADGYTDPSLNKFEADAGWELIDQYSKDRKWKIGDLKSASPSDARQAVRAVTEIPAQVAARGTKLGGKAPNMVQLRQEIADIIDRNRVSNPKNKEAWGPLKWQYTDEIVDWDKVNKELNSKYQLNSSYTSPFMKSSVSLPAFMIDKEGSKFSMEDIEAVAKAEGKTVQKIIEEEGLKPAK